MVRLVRSTRSDYNLANKQKTTAHLIIADDLPVDTLKGLFRSLQSLAYSELSDDEPPVGCSILTVSDKIEVRLVLKVNTTVLLRLSCIRFPSTAFKSACSIYF